MIHYAVSLGFGVRESHRSVSGPSLTKKEGRRMVRVIRIFVAILVLGVAANAQQKLKVYISADMEGVGGVDTQVQTSAQGREYEKFRRLMTLEVNAAISGAFDAGATEVLVSDSHGDAQNIDV